MRCELCGRPVVGLSAPIHPCCRFWISEKGHSDCSACIHSEFEREEWEKAQERKAREDVQSAARRK